MGLAAGILGLKGWPICISYVFLVFFGAIGYQSYLQVEVDDFSQQELFLEGLSNATAIFMLLWVVLTT